MNKYPPPVYISLAPHLLGLVILLIGLTHHLLVGLKLIGLVRPPLLGLVLCLLSLLKHLIHRGNSLHSSQCSSSQD